MKKQKKCVDKKQVHMMEGKGGQGAKKAFDKILEKGTGDQRSKTGIGRRSIRWN